MDEATIRDYAVSLLDDFARLPATGDHAPTFLEIQGYPHLEDVSSNVLAFFMDPVEVHGLGTLLLDALADAAVIAVEEGGWGDVSIEREVWTSTGKRIDLLITSDDHAILIENKIRAAVKNPFRDYAEHLDLLAEGRTKHRLLLTLYPTRAGSDWGFENLTHETLARHIRLALSRTDASGDDRYRTMVRDFLDTIDNLRKGTRMNMEFVRLLAERSDDVERLLTDLNSFGNELKQKVRALQELVDADRPGVRAYIASRGKLTQTSVHEVHVATEDLLFHINTNITQHGWDIDFDIPRKVDYPRLSAYLERRGIAFADRERYGFVYPRRFPYDEDLGGVAAVVQGLVDDLAAEGSE